MCYDAKEDNIRKTSHYTKPFLMLGKGPSMNTPVHILQRYCKDDISYTYHYTLMALIPENKCIKGLILHNDTIVYEKRFSSMFAC